MADSSNFASCNACGSGVRILRDFGPQALTNEFPSDKDEKVRFHPVILGQCHACDLVQLCRPCPADLVKPLRPMHYNEPEGHLDALVDEIVILPGVSPASRFCGVTYKDASTLQRLRQRGYDELMTISLRDNLQITDDRAGLETIQSRVTPELAEAIIARHGKFDVVLVRHLLEHAHDLTSFLAAISCLTAQAGYIIFEVPDCTTMFDALDYSFLWEEHISYFTPPTLASALRQHGLSPGRVLTYPYALENSLVAITTRDQSPRRSILEQPAEPSDECLIADRYGASFPRTRKSWHNVLTAFKRQGPVAVLGAGHLAVTWINLLGLEPLIDYVCDDAADKVDRYIPGTQLRISPSSVLLQHPFSVCLMAVAPESEPKVLARNQEFIDRGGRFASIFAASDHALKLNTASEPESDKS